MNENLPSLLKPYRERVEGALKRAMPESRPDDGGVTLAMSDSLFAGGKRIRPILCMLTFDAAGGEPCAIDDIAAALEMIHTYSLIHDDLPCMDDDDLRRGRPACHVTHGEAVALLAGDGLHTEAFAQLARAGNIPADRRIRMTAELASAVGVSGMVGGQALDLLAEREPVTAQDRLEQIHRKKTGAFIAASAILGAVGAGASESEIASIRQYGESLGLAFQIADDLLDVTATAEEAGKRVGKDAERGKTTYPGLIGQESSLRLAHELVDRSVQSLPFDTDDRLLAAVARFVVDRIG